MISVIDVSETKLRKTVGFVPAAFIMMILQFIWPENFSISVFCATFFAIYIAYICYVLGRLSSPFVSAAIALFMYSFLPLLPGPDLGIFGQFSLIGAHRIYAVAGFALVTGVYLCSLIPDRRSPAPLGGALTNTEVSAAASVAATISICLCLLYAARFGVLGMGGLSYADTFTQRLETGSGILFLTVPFALTSAAIAFSRPKLSLLPCLLVVLAYSLLFITLGQRKFLLAPLMIFVSSRLAVRSIRAPLLAVVSLFLGILVFGYFGYLRITLTPISDALRSELLLNYWENIGSYISGEAPTLYATAGAAYDGFVAPLPYGSDYLMSWKMSVPQFLVPVDFENMGVRFAFAFTPTFAEAGGGWGFSFFGEGYVVAGYVGVVLATWFVLIIFRVTSSLARPSGRNNFFYFLVIAGIYHALWFQRNAFAYFFKEYIFQQSLSILITLLLVRIILTPFSRGQIRALRTPS